ncbi:MAG: archaeal proteasome endopeptidase complex subunit alpha [archaeon]
MEQMTHQMMGYDRTSTMFSPDGRLLQVEYAKEAVRQGSTAIGLVCKDGVLLIADKRVVDKLMVGTSVEKIFQIDDHIGATATGFVMDGRVLIEKAQVMAQQHRVTYAVPIETPSLVKEVADMKQFYTQYGGARPFGVSILFIGVDDGHPKLFVTDPTGIFFEFKATAIGEGEVEAKEFLRKTYKETMNIEEGAATAMQALKKVLGKEFDIRRIDGAYIKTAEKQFHRMDKRLLRG